MLDGLLNALDLPKGEIFLSEGGEPAAIVLLPDETAVRAVMPDFAALGEIPLFMTIVTAPGDEQDVASRVFCPFVGIDEDPVTGAAHAALVPFWAERLGRTPLHRPPGKQAHRAAGLRAKGRSRHPRRPCGDGDRGLFPALGRHGLVSHRRLGRDDGAAAEQPFAVIEHRRLAGGDAIFGGGEGQAFAIPASRDRPRQAADLGFDLAPGPRRAS